MMVLKVFITIQYNIFMYGEFVYLNIGMYFIPDLISIKFNYLVMWRHQHKTIAFLNQDVP